MVKKSAIIAVIVILMSMMWNGAAKGTGELTGRTIILDAGHGKETTNVYAGYDEGAAMLKLAQKLKPKLEEHGAEVILTREDEHSVELIARPAIINKVTLEAVLATRIERGIKTAEEEKEVEELERLIEIQRKIIEDPERYGEIYMNSPFDYSYKREIHPDLKRVFEYQREAEVSENYLVISLHTNATPAPINTGTNGAIIFHITNDGKNRSYYGEYTNVERSKTFANIALEGIAELGIRNRGAVGDCWAMIREHNVPGVLAENGFHTNSGDRSKLMSEDFIEKLAMVYTESITEYYRVTSAREEENPEMEQEVKPEAEDETEGIELPYTDIESCAWYYEAVKAITEQRIFYGITEEIFAPDAVMTRGMFITALYRYSGEKMEEDGNELGISDLAKDDPYYEPVKWAIMNGLLTKNNGSEEEELFIENGEDGQKSLTPNGEVTREEMAVAIHNYVQKYKQVESETVTIGFTDGAEIDPQSEQAVLAVQEYGIIKGYAENQFSPKSALTRAETAQILYNLMTIPVMEQEYQ